MLLQYSIEDVFCRPSRLFWPGTDNGSESPLELTRMYPTPKILGLYHMDLSFGVAENGSGPPWTGKYAGGVEAPRRYPDDRCHSEIHYFVRGDATGFI